MSEPGLLQLHADLVECLVRSGREPEARAIAGALAERPTSSDRRGLRAAVLRCRALLLPEPDALDALAEALTHLDRTPFERARTELSFGMRLNGAGKVDDGRRHLTIALDLFASRSICSPRSGLDCGRTSPAPSCGRSARH